MLARRKAPLGRSFDGNAKIPMDYRWPRARNRAYVPFALVWIHWRRCPPIWQNGEGYTSSRLRRSAQLAELQSGARASLSD